MQKCMFKLQFINLIDKTLYSSKSDGQSSMELVEMSAMYSRTFTINTLQKEQDTSQSFSDY